MLLYKKLLLMTFGTTLVTMYRSLVSLWLMKTQSGLADGPNLQVRCQG